MEYKFNMNIIYVKKRRKLGYGFPDLDASGDNFQTFTDAVTKYTCRTT